MGVFFVVVVFVGGWGVLASFIALVHPEWTFIGFVFVLLLFVFLFLLFYLIDRMSTIVGSLPSHDDCVKN